MRGHAKTILEVTGLGVAIVGAAASLAFSVLTRADVRDQRQLQAIELLKSRNERVEKWATQVVDAMTEGVFFCLQPESDRKSKRPPLMTRLSSLIDQGRFIIPNESPEIFGQEKPRAYRGFRPKVLDHPVAMYDLVDRNTCSDTDVRKPLESNRHELRREFVSDVQDLLDPREYNRRLKELTKRLG